MYHTRKSRPLKVRSGFTLIELLIVIAIILILIAIALPNFLAAQARARVAREQSDMRTIAVAIESLRVDFGLLLVDFWDDDSGLVLFTHFYGRPPSTEPPRFAACCSWHATNKRGGTTGLFSALTTPIAYLHAVPVDPFGFERGDQGLIDDDVYPPISYMYHDREAKDIPLTGEDFKGVFGCYRGGCVPGTHGILAPLRMDNYLLVGFGPDSTRTDSGLTPYSPTNGTSSLGDVIYRSDGGV